MTGFLYGALYIGGFLFKLYKKKKDLI